jgi:phytoene dehydrogenase-like protein
MYGGGLATVEATLPGFYHNSHSINHIHISATPWFRDLALAEKVAYVTPRYEFGQPHPDGSALVFSRDLAATLASVARFSRRDAATFRDWNRRAEAATRDILLPERFSEPLPRYTARTYGAEPINMRSGDIFMGAFSADQVMYNHFGYRTSIPGLYMAGSACHPGGAISGGAGYISAGLIARDLDIQPWWRPVDARASLERLS